MDDDITITVLHPSGALELSTMHSGLRVSRRYYDYLAAEALADFKTRLTTNRNA